MGPMASAAAASAAVGLERLAPGVPAPLRGFEYPAPRHPSYLRQERTDDVDELMPLARSHVRRRYGRSALGNISADDELLIITYPHQHDAVFEALRRALLEEGVKRVDRLDMTDLGMDVEEFSAADGWREISGRLAAMVEEGVEYKASAAALKRFLEDRPGYTGVFAGESGRRHWKRAAGKRVRNNWCYATYEDFISRANGYPDEVWREVDLKVVQAFANAAKVRVTSPEGTDISWDVTEQQADLWVRGAWQSGHILGSTIQGIRFGHPVETFLEEAKILFPTLNGVVAGTSNHTGYYPHIAVTIENGVIAALDGGDHAVLDRDRDVGVVAGVVAGARHHPVQGGEQDLGLLKEGLHRMAEADPLDGRAQDVPGLPRAPDPQVGLLLGDVPADVGALRAGHPHLGGVRERLHHLEVDLAPDLVGVAVGARDEVLIGGVAPVVAHPVARHPLPVRAARLAREHAGVAGRSSRKRFRAAAAP